MTAPVIVVAGLRGGSMSTSLAANLAGLISRSGNRTLLVCLDRHADAALDVGTTATKEPAVQTVRPGLDLLTVGTGPVSDVLITRAVERARDEYDLVLLDGSGGSPAASALALRVADWWLVTTRSDRAATGVLVAELDRPGPPVLGIVVTGVSSRPRAHLARARQTIVEGCRSAGPVFLSAVRSAAGVAWWARDRGVLLHELVTEIDRAVLDDEVVEQAIGLARDYRDIASELLVRLDSEVPESWCREADQGAVPNPR